MENPKTLKLETFQNEINKAVDNHSLAGAIEFVVSNRFIDEYNSTTKRGLKENINRDLERLIESIKLKNTIPSLRHSANTHLNLSLAWTNLCGISMCHGRLQHVALEAVASSLRTADLHQSHTHSLFYLLQTSLHLLASQLTLTSHLSKMEVSVLEVAYLSSKRLLVHFFLNHFTSKEFCNRMHDYHKSLVSSPAAYQHHPSIQYMHDYMRYFIFFIFSIASDEMAEARSYRRSSRTTTVLPPLISTPLPPILVSAIHVCMEARRGEVADDTLRKAFECCTGEFNKDNWIGMGLALDLVKEVCYKDIRVLSFVQQLTAPPERSSGFTAWHEDLCITYINLLADVIKHSKDPAIKRKALLGSYEDLSDLKNSKSMLQCLTHALFLHLPNKDDLSWRLRHCALTKLAFLAEGSDTITCEKDELETIVKVVCWGLLMKMRAEENNNKVLEAINVIELLKPSPTQEEESQQQHFSVFSQYNQTTSLDERIVSHLVSRWAELNKKTDCTFSKQQSADDADKLWDDQSQEDMYLSRNQPWLGSMKHFNVILLSTKLSDPASSSVATDAEVLAKKADEKWLKMIKNI